MADRTAALFRKQVLIVDDDPINRQMLGYIVETGYDVLYAENGREALELLQRLARQISLVLLDLVMPEMDGKTLMARMRQEEALQHIPIIVLTSEVDAEVECLKQGASDFIKKPYDMPEVIIARVNRTIELAEDRRIIQTVETDDLTGLYHKDFFFEYASTMDIRHPGMKMDAVVVDLDHFHLYNEMHGRAAGDQALQCLGQAIGAVLADTVGIGCRCEADTFFIYCAHREDYPEVQQRLGKALQSLGEGVPHLRMGVCTRTDLAQDLVKRFDRARAACNRVRGDYRRAISFYDENLYQHDIYAQRLVNEMSEGIRQGQFQVYYQPKYNVRGRTPVLHSAEALIRWIHPEMGMISPGVFIPLFEQNGMIRELDRFVWRETARQIARWREKFGVLLPVSVNVSRIDLFDEDLLGELTRLREEFDLPQGSQLLEITESSYTANMEQALTVIRALRANGFPIEMDDFGSGYSSLNMLLHMPLDALKVDGAFMRSIRREDAWLIRTMADIARHLGVPTIFEGVEEESQVQMIREIGGDIIQGYYFSKPLPPEQFEMRMTTDLKRQAEEERKAEETHADTAGAE